MNKKTYEDVPTDFRRTARHNRSLLAHLVASRRLILFVTLFLWALVSTYAFVGFVPQYTSEATVLVKNTAITGKYITGDSDDTTSSTFTNPILNSMGLLETEQISLPLWAYLKTKRPAELKRLNLRSYSDWETYYGNGKRFIKAKNTPGTDFINFSFKWPEPVVAKEGLGVVLQAFKEASLKVNQAEQHERSEYLYQQLDGVKRRLALLRQNISDFKENQRTVDIANESENYTKARIELETLYKAVTAEASAKEAELRQYQRMLGMSDRQAVNASALGGNQNLSRLHEDLYTAKADYKQKRARYTDDHPQMKSLLSQISQLEQNIEKETNRTLGKPDKTPVAKSGTAAPRVESGALVMDRPRGDAVTNMLNTKAQVESLNSKMSVLRQQLGEMDAKMVTLPKIQQNLTNLQDEEQTLSESIKTLEQKALDARMKELQTLSNIFIVDHPKLPRGANFPNRVHLILLGLLMGLTCGVATAMLTRKAQYRPHYETRPPVSELLWETQVGGNHNSSEFEKV